MDWLYGSLLTREAIAPMASRSLRAPHHPIRGTPAAHAKARVTTRDLSDYHCRPHHVITAPFNRAALDQLRLGNVARAELLCRRAIAICRQMVDRGYPDWWAVAMVEPWVNLARLASIRGDTDRALQVFAQVYDSAIDNAPVDIEGYQFDTPRLTRLLETLEGIDEARAAIEASYHTFLHGSFRALVTAGRADEACAFVLEQLDGDGARRPPPEKYRDDLLELRCLGFLAAGKFDAALEAVDALDTGDRASAWAPVATAILTAEVRLWSGDPLEADRWWWEAVSRLAQLRRGGGGGPIGYLLMRIAVGRMACDSVHEHRRLVEAACGYAQSERAAVHLLRCCGIMSRLEAQENTGSHEWRDRLAQLARETPYRLDQAAAYCELFRSARGAEANDIDLVDAYALASTIDSLEAAALSGLIERHNGAIDALDLRSRARRRRARWNPRESDAVERQFHALMNDEVSTVSE
jgi:hypothetical protein